MYYECPRLLLSFSRGICQKSKSDVWGQMWQPLKIKKKTSPSKGSLPSRTLFLSDEGCTGYDKTISWRATLWIWFNANATASSQCLGPPKKSHTFYMLTISLIWIVIFIMIKLSLYTLKKLLNSNAIIWGDDEGHMCPTKGIKSIRVGESNTDGKISSNIMSYRIQFNNSHRNHLHSTI